MQNGKTYVNTSVLTRDMVDVESYKNYVNTRNGTKSLTAPDKWTVHYLALLQEEREQYKQNETIHYSLDDYTEAEQLRIVKRDQKQ